MLWFICECFFIEIFCGFDCLKVDLYQYNCYLDGYNCKKEGGLTGKDECSRTTFKLSRENTHDNKYQIAIVSKKNKQIQRFIVIGNPTIFKRQISGKFMMDTPLPMVTIIVKAPNQKIEDQQIRCELTWTIQKLKQHLSEVYPSKPPKQEQKLIYSGQLLSDDGLALKDVLRQYDDGHDIHTVHLVCSTPNNFNFETNYRHEEESSSSETASTSRSSSDDSRTVQSSQSDDRIISSDGGASAFMAYYQMQHQQWMNYAMEHPQEYARHLALQQQAYFQFYAHYMSTYLANTNSLLTNGSTNTNQFYEAYRQQQHPEPQETVQNPPVEQQEEQQHLQVEQQQQQHDDQQQQQNRDWLDVFYMFSRILVFVSIVYFYSSPLRFCCVLIFAFGLYLYQIGLLRNPQQNNNNNNNNNNNTRDGGGGGITDDNTEEDMSISASSSTESIAPTRLSVFWNFFTAFFTSLIPEAPPNVV